MYYIVRLAGIKERQKHYVFPVSWMRDCKSQLEKFVRNRINKNQLQLFFWSNKKNENGEPDDNIQPNFNLPIQNSFPSTVDGCYYGQPIDFLFEYTLACDKLSRYRPVVPGLYNETRMLEAPLPNLTQNISEQNAEGDNQQDESNVSSSSDIPEHELSNASEGQENQNDAITSSSNLVTLGACGNEPNNDLAPLAGSSGTSNQTHDSVPTNSINDLSAHNHESKPELHSLQRTDLVEIDAILNADQEERAELIYESDSDSDIEIIIFNGVVPKPVQYSILKHENDPISGDWAYAEAPQVCVRILYYFMYHV